MSEAQLSENHERLVDTFFAALEEGSISGVLACYTPDARIWHNFDQVTVSPEGNVEGLETLFRNFASRRYVDVRRQATAGGLVQQHILRLETPDGRMIDWPGCIVFDFRDGLISRLDEYVDLASLSAGT